MSQRHQQAGQPQDSTNPYRAYGGTLEAVAPSVTNELTARARWFVMLAAFFGWFAAGMLMSVTPLTSRSATLDLLDPGLKQQLAADGRLEEVVLQWFAGYNAAFLFGAATGGLIFGWMGDHFGRRLAMGSSILCFTLLTLAAYFVQSPTQLLVMRFVACLGVGGMWPNGIALASEAWPGVGRPIIAGIIGTAANVGLVLIGLLARVYPIDPEHWRWLLVLVGSVWPLGLAVLLFVPESPRWLESRRLHLVTKPSVPVVEVFRPPLLRVTLTCIVLGTVPMMGGWANGNWLVPWADKAGDAVTKTMTEEEKKEAKQWKANAQLFRSLGGAISSLLGGVVAVALGRRFSYFLISALALSTASYIFNFMQPGDTYFNFGVFTLGVLSGFYFGWMPLCLPEYFPTRVRSTGAGITFNFGRYLAAAGVLGAGSLSHFFGGDYARIGAITSLIYAVGMIAIWFAPARRDTALAE